MSSQAKPRSATSSRATKKVSTKKSYKKARRSIRKATTSAGMRYPGAGARLGASLGSVFGPVGSIAGSALGGLAHQAIHSLTGFGDYSLPNYELKSNSLLEIGDPPRIENAGKEFVVRHREYIGDLYSGVAGAPGAAQPSPFTLVSYPINPGLNQTFPWLTNVASRFEEYSIEGMMFEYKSLYSDAVVQTGGSLGAVILATEYNAAKPNFASKIEMENYEFAQSSKPSVSMAHPIECSPHQTPLNELYIRQPTTDLDGQDIKTYDLGKFQIASQGIPVSGSSVSLGEIWVTYQIRLFKPRVSQYVDSGFFEGYVNNVVQASGGNFLNEAEAWSTNSFVNSIDVQLNKELNQISLPLFSNERDYSIVLDVRDPNNAITQGAAIGYYASAAPTVTNGGLVIPAIQGFANPVYTAVSGSVITSGTSYTIRVRTYALAPGNTRCTIQLPSGGCGSGLTLIKNIVINAVPRTGTVL